MNVFRLTCVTPILGKTVLDKLVYIGDKTVKQ